MFLRFAAAFVAVAMAAAAPALADAPLSVQIGPQFPTQSSGRNAGGDVATDIGANYDVGPPLPLPFRASLQADYAHGSHGNGKLDDFGIGIAARLTTPIYAGAGISLYSVNVRLDDPAAVSRNVVGAGENFFIGDRVLSLPGGLAFSVQGTYKLLPSAGGVDASNVGVGLRVQL